MESRMEKYYKEDLSTFERSKRNANLYKDVSNQMSEFDNLPIPDNSNEIDIDSLKKMISSRDEYRKAKELNRVPASNNAYVKEDVSLKKDNNKIYDINVLLENAKNEINKGNKLDDNKKINTNFLTSLEDANIPLPNNDDAIEVSTTTFDNSNKVPSNTDSLPLDILVDLKGDDNTAVTDPIVKEEVTMIKNIKDGETFYSGSFNFSKKDFDEDDDEMFITEKNHTGIKVFFLIVSLLAIGAIVYLIITKYVL